MVSEITMKLKQFYMGKISKNEDNPDGIRNQYKIEAVLYLYGKNIQKINNNKLDS